MKRLPIFLLYATCGLLVMITMFGRAGFGLSPHGQDLPVPRSCTYKVVSASLLPGATAGKVLYTYDIVLFRYTGMLLAPACTTEQVWVACSRGSKPRVIAHKVVGRTAIHSVIGIIYDVRVEPGTVRIKDLNRIRTKAGDGYRFRLEIGVRCLETVGFGIGSCGSTSESVGYLGFSVGPITLLLRPRGLAGGGASAKPPGMGKGAGGG